MFERFSSGYYLGRLYVEPGERDAAAMSRAQHEQVNEQLYGDEGVTRADLPLVMKLENTHFPVYGDERVPADTVVMPERLLEGTDVRNPPSLREMFLAKAERARQLLSVAAGTPTSEKAVEEAVPDRPFDGFDGPTGV